MKKLAILLICLLSSGSFAQDAELKGVMVAQSQGKALIEALKEGGYVIYFRHGITERVKGNPDPDNLEDCGVQRNLSAEGIEQTKAIGAVFATENIPIGGVYSSPYCRCRDTAENIAGKTAEILSELAWPIQVTPAERMVLDQHLKTLLAIPPQPGTNTILVSHTANLQSALGKRPKNEGDGYVFKPLAE